MIQISDRTKSIMASGEAKLHFGGDTCQVCLESVPTCSLHCPAGVNVKGYVNLVANRRYEEALELIREANPLPGICGRVCTHPCEANCGRSKTDEALSIKALKRFAADYEVSRKSRFQEKCLRKFSEKVAVIGSGPAGLTVAADLVKLGYETVVFEATRKPGGMLVWGIPEFRLPRKVIEREIAAIQAMGVEIKTGRKVDKPWRLLNEGFAAVILAVGAWTGLALKIEGDNQEGVLDCLNFLRKVNAGEYEKLQGKVVVIGGGNSALDAARTALRLGAEKVTIAYRRTENEMPANPPEIREAREEGITLETLCIPQRILGKNRVEAVEFLKAELGEVDSSGRRRPVPIKGSEFTISADWVIPAVSAKPDISGYEENAVKLKWDLIEVQENSQTSLPGVFAIGDVVRGPSTVVEVMGDAHRCAAAVHSHLRKDASHWNHIKNKETRSQAIIHAPDQACSLEKARREVPAITSPESRRHSLQKEVESALTERQATLEASRCLRCGSCDECEVCLPTCDSKQVVGLIEGEELLIKVPRQLSRKVYDQKESFAEVRAGSGRNPMRLVSLTPKVDPSLCIACGRCEEACAYRAIRVGIKAQGKAYSYVDHDICRGCGRCLFACPTSAVGLDAYNTLGEKILKSIQHNGGVVVFGSYWSLSQKDREQVNVVDLMSLEMLTPALLVEALAAGATGVLVADSQDRHYLPIGTTARSIVESTRTLLTLGGVHPERVSRDTGKDLVGAVRDLQSTYRRAGLRPLSPPKDIPDFRGRIAKALALLSALGQQDGRDKADDLCLTAKALELHGFPACQQMLDSRDALSTSDVSKLAKERRYRPRFRRIGLLTEGQNAKAIESVKSALLTMDGIICELVGPTDCGASRWKSPDAASRQKAMEVFREAERLKLEAIIPLDPDCLSHLTACNRAGAWRHSSVNTVDIYSFFASSREA